MKFRVLFLRRKTLIYIGLSILIIILAIVLLSLKHSAATFNNVESQSKMIKDDFTGDGKKDILYIKTENGRYNLELNSEDRSLFLAPSKNLNTIGTNYDYWPLRLTVLDITRDKVPEIFTQASDNGKAIIHVFYLTDGKYNDIFTSNNNTLGIIDSNNSKSPKFVCGNFDGTSLTFSHYMLIKDNLMNCNMAVKDSYLGKDTIISLIKYLESLPKGETDKPSYIFMPNLKGSDLALIGKMAGENNTYKFQDAAFKDVSWNKKGEPTEIEWRLNFVGKSNSNASIVKNYNVVVRLSLTTSSDKDKYIFKINKLSN